MPKHRCDPSRQEQVKEASVPRPAGSALHSSGASFRIMRNSSKGL
jgi:hypothetical protein